MAVSGNVVDLGKDSEPRTATERRPYPKADLVGPALRRGPSAIRFVHRENKPRQHIGGIKLGVKDDEKNPNQITRTPCLWRHDRVPNGVRTRMA